MLKIDQKSVKSHQKSSKIKSPFHFPSCPCWFYASIWFKNVKTYVDAYPDMQGFLPIVVDVDERMNF